MNPSHTLHCPADPAYYVEVNAITRTAVVLGPNDSHASYDHALKTNFLEDPARPAGAPLPVNVYFWLESIQKQVASMLASASLAA